jgi:hypothetical protein
MSSNLVSWLAEDQQQGGLWPEGDSGIGVIVGQMFEVGTGPFTGADKYTTKDPVTVHILAIRPEGKEDVIYDLCSGGDAARMVPSVDGINMSRQGHLLIKAPGTNTTGLAAGSNLAIRFAHLQKIAVGDNKQIMMALQQNGNLLVGNKVHFVSIPQPKREGLTKVNRPGMEQKEKRGDGRILLINRFLEGPLAAYSPQQAPAVVVPGAPAAAFAPPAFQAPAPMAPPAPAPAPAPAFQPPPMAAPAFSPAPMAFGAPAGALSFPAPSPAFPPMAAPQPAPIPAPAPPPSQPAPQAVPTSSTPFEYVGGLLRQAISSNPQGIMFRDLPQMIRPLVPAADPNLLAQVIQTVVNQDFLKSAQGWSFDGAVVKPA